MSFLNPTYGAENEQYLSMEGKISAVSSNFTQLLSGILPVEKSTIYVEQKSHQVRQFFASKLTTDIVVGESNSFWSLSTPSRYTVSLDNDIIQIEGPFGNRRWCLTTKIEIVETPGDTALRLEMRLSKLHLMFALLGLGFYLGFGLFVLEFWPLWPVMVIQVLFMYGIILAIFRYEASLIKDTIARLVREV